MPSPAWRASLDDGILVVSAGADVVHAAVDLDEESARQLLDGWERGAIDPTQLRLRARETLEALDGAGAVRRGPEAERPTDVKVRFAGMVEPRLERWLRDALDDSQVVHRCDDDADLVLVVRTTARLVELYDDARPEPTRHLLLDLAYHHTVSLGPFVVPGETACLACLAGRIGSLWGDAPPPDRPAVLESPALAAVLAVRELERLARGDFRLANATVAYDLYAHRVVTCPVYRLPWCPACGDEAAAPPGHIELPWVNAA